MEIVRDKELQDILNEILKAKYCSISINLTPNAVQQ